MMHPNTANSIEMGRNLLRTFGSWQKGREAATQRDGVYFIGRDAIAKAKAERPVNASAWGRLASGWSALCYFYEPQFIDVRVQAGDRKTPDHAYFSPPPLAVTGGAMLEFG